ncbi:MAG: DUF6460 domain-containing protein [Hyphomicrobiaceae bacterium]
MSRENWFGGNPLAVVVRLVLLSIVVGVVLSALGITPRNFLYEIEMLVSRIYRLGLSSFEWVLQYLLLGAMVVVPVWLVARLLGLLGGARRSNTDTVGDSRSKHSTDT